MPFVSRPGLNGKIYIPEQLPGQKKHNCKSCFSCQVCSDDRCCLCLGQMCKKAETHKTIIKRNCPARKTPPVVTAVAAEDRVITYAI